MFLFFNMACCVAPEESGFDNLATGSASTGSASTGSTGQNTTKPQSSGSDKEKDKSKKEKKKKDDKKKKTNEIKTLIKNLLKEQTTPFNPNNSPKSVRRTQFNRKAAPGPRGVLLPNRGKTTPIRGKRSR